MLYLLKNENHLKYIAYPKTSISIEIYYIKYDHKYILYINKLHTYVNQNYFFLLYFIVAHHFECTLLFVQFSH